MVELMDGDLTGHLLTCGVGLGLGRVTDNVDPEGRGRVRVTMLALDVVLWASLVVPSAGKGYGAAFLPKIHEIVVVAFLTPELAFVLGAVWSGGQSEPAHAVPAEKRYSITMPSGLKAVFDDDDGPSVALTTPTGYNLKLTDGGGGKFSVTLGATTIEVTPDSVDVTAASEVKLQASSVTVSAPQVTVNAAMSNFSGVVQCDTLIANSVVGTSYAPGAGNIW
jgi:uncharacterized protein involved in type VI secretion and phage assembly